jgi:hypothetical protein
MLSQLRAGGIELLVAPSLTLSTAGAPVGLPSIGFAFRSLRSGLGGRWTEAWATSSRPHGKAAIVPIENLGRGSYPLSQGRRISQPDLEPAWLFRVFPSRVGAGKGVKIACLAPLVALR